ncbi:glycosyltransferase family 2 protein [Sphingopyxis alaskensis]|jgi:teichuronic acid biosynthesis glycosyltransferase TuaG|uniref:Glycosyl transferase, family 2 n=1 Tax=Sphingopyxis alaskensis (strain DSM 13593 / LMG 18877 / RB2256) TaxID=317655 RepID=Q1GST9_SPHAL|nr:glycosyltransferase family 2 protein [Sphingopyxis alaskensis]ABF53283.1 glycosyl transferase, family 2 [Sphingopyxis alaskensis RB2256]MCM3418703.1 glycosyltransferase [Sphingopyxis alaskensis]
MSDNLVSIITPAYKAADIIAETICSVQSQTHREWEMLIAEDCGPDETRAIVREFARADPRVRLLQMPVNGGPAAARNLALSTAKGRWLAFLDSDDLWLPEKLERQLAFHRTRDDAVISFTGFRRINAEGSETGRYIGVPPVMDYRALLGNTAIATSTVIVDRQQSGEFRMQKTYYDDFACWLALLRKGKVAIGLDEDLMRYRVMAQSVSRNKGNSARQVWLAYRNIEKLSPLAAAWYFAQYSARAFLKYRRF